MGCAMCLVVQIISRFTLCAPETVHIGPAMVTATRLKVQLRCCGRLFWFAQLSK